MTKYIILISVLILVIAGCNVNQNKTGEQKTVVDAEQIKENKALARRWFDEVINQRNVDAINDIYAAGYVHHGPEGMDVQGLDTVRTFAAAILNASEDRHATVDQQVAEGDLVVTRFSSRGHHTGSFRGEQPTGKVWTTEGIVISRIENGKIVEDWEITHQSGI
jgi:predicted ester cyclase